MIPQRKSIRLKGYDYSQKGMFFVTLKSFEGRHIFGHIEQGKMLLNQLGVETQNCWLEIPNHFPHVKLHEFVIMPNHLHGIIEITSNSNTPNKSNDLEKQKESSSQVARSPSKTLGSIIRGFKIGVTKWARQNTDINDVWQRNYHDIIIWDGKMYVNITQYIINNPKKWETK